MSDTFTVGKFTVRIEQDADSESPREWSNLGTMVCWHRRYNLGDDHSFDSPEDFRESLEYLDAAIILPLYLYDHSGITISCAEFSCPWDSGQVGYIYVSKEQVRKEYSVKRISKKTLALAESALRAEVHAYDEYLTGQVYGYVVEEDGEHIDSCWGFYGLDYCKQEAKSAAEYAMRESEKTDAMVSRYAL